MNRRQRKKKFKQRYGINPPKGYTMQQVATVIEVKDTILRVWETIKETLLNIADHITEWLKKMPQEQIELFKKEIELKQIEQRAEETAEKERKEREQWE